MNTVSRLMQSETAQHAYFGSQHSVHNLCEIVAQKDFSFLSPRKLSGLLSAIQVDTLEDWAAFQQSWDDLQQDHFMKDGGTYRRRRHATFRALPGATTPELQAHQPHYQSLDYNSLNGGIARHFAPVQPHILQNRVMLSILELCCTLFGRLAPYYGWHIEVHQFRIDAAQAAASPTPEGVHRDGVNFVFMMLVDRVNVVNGETTIYDRHKRPLTRYTLTEPLEAAIVNDEQVMHGVTPIVQLDPNQPAYRDMLVVTFSKR